MEPTLFLLPLSLRLPFVLVDKKQQSTEGEGETSPFFTRDSTAALPAQLDPQNSTHDWSLPCTL